MRLILITFAPMAPLYKRYIPPKPTPLSEAAALGSAEAAVERPTPEADKKRKRERTHGEIAERKAKKLKNGKDGLYASIPFRIYNSIH